MDLIRNYILEKKLIYKARKALPNSAFVFPEKRAYPIHDLAHARNALARVSQFGSPAEQATVHQAVYQRYPQMAKRKAEREPVKLAAHLERPGKYLNG